MTKLLLKTPATLVVDGVTYRCASGRGGCKVDKIEGDGATPIGTFSLSHIYYRADRLQLPTCCLPTTAISPTDGWCDDPTHALYNQLVTLPFSASHEEMWRQDHVYDIVIVVDYNLDPVVSGKGSAIFMHLARPNYEPTAGCIALNLEDMLKIIPLLTLDSQLVVLS